MQARSPRGDASRAALLLALILNICFFPCIWGNKTLLASARDAPSILPDGAWAGKHITPRFPKTLDEGAPAFQTEPWFAVIGSEYRAGTLPIWNPYQAYGRPLAANMQSQPFYPLTALLSVVLTPRTYNWYILLRLFFAGFCMYLYLRYFVSFVPALAGGCAAMLAGYYILFITMAQLSVETALPAALLALEYLLRSPSAKSILAFAVVVFLVMTGGMPESALLLLSFVYVYLCVRLASDPALRPAWFRHAGRIILSTIAGFGLSALLLFPFVELLRVSFDLHQPANIGGAITGLGHDQFNVSIWTYLFPLIFGPPFFNTLGPGYTGLRNYFGVIALFLIFVSLVAAFRRVRGHNRQLQVLSLFLISGIVVLIMKRYGAEPVNEIGNLPLFRMVWFGKYEEAIVSICVAILCGLGLDSLLRRELSGFRVAIAFVLTGVLSAVGVVLSRPVAKQQIALGHLARHYPRIAVIVPGCALVLAGIAIFFFLRTTRGIALGRSALARIVLVLLVGELSLNYIATAYYRSNFLPDDSSNPYVGAPYISALQASRVGDYRIVARKGTLFPNWASAFALFDIRNSDAMDYIKYFPFLRTFLPAPPSIGNDVDLGDRFSGTGDYDFGSPLQRRLLQLSSVKFIAGPPMPPRNDIVQAMLDQNRGLLIPGREANISRRTFMLDGESKDGIGEHPPYERLPYRVRLPDSGPQIFHFSYALDPAVYDKPGDGVGFTIEVKDAANHITKLFSNYIDPKRYPSQRHWFNGEIDLGAYRGQGIELLFSTDPGPKGDTGYDWAAWSGFSFNNEPTASPEPFRLVHSGDAFVYEYDDVVPRAAIYYQADLESGEQKVLQKLADPSFDVFQTTVLDSATLDSDERAALTRMASGDGKRLQPARIVSYQSRSVAIDATLESPGILVLNDSDYPGWKVNVDGRPGKWFTANYMFRGLLLPAGRHTVRFTYSPASFRYGGLISLVTACCLVALVFFERKRAAAPNSAAVTESQAVNL